MGSITNASPDEAVPTLLSTASPALGTATGAVTSGSEGVGRQSAQRGRSICHVSPAAERLRLPGNLGTSTFFLAAERSHAAKATLNPQQGYSSPPLPSPSCPFRSKFIIKT